MEIDTTLDINLWAFVKFNEELNSSSKGLQYNGTFVHKKGNGPDLMEYKYPIRTTKDLAKTIMSALLDKEGYNFQYWPKVKKKSLAINLYTDLEKAGELSTRILNSSYEFNRILNKREIQNVTKELFNILKKYRKK